MTARAFLPYPRQFCKFLFICNIFQIGDLQVLMRNVREWKGRESLGSRRCCLFPGEISPLPPPQNPSHAPHCFVCLQHRCSVALLLAKPAVCGAPCLVGCMFLGVVLDMKSAPEISSQPQDLTDSFIEGTAYPFFESSALKIHMQTISSLPFQGVLVMCICQLPDAPRFCMTINVNKRDKHYPGI